MNLNINRIVIILNNNISAKVMNEEDVKKYINAFQTII